MVMYDAALGQIHIMLSGVIMPMPMLADGKLASIYLTGSAQATGALAQVTLTDVSLGDADGNEVPAEVQVLAPDGIQPGLFLPLVTR